MLEKENPNLRLHSKPFFFFFFAVASVLDAELLRSRRGLFSTSLTSGYESELAISTETVLIVTCVRGYFLHT